MIHLNEHSTETFVVLLPVRVELNAVRDWLNKYIGDEEEVVDVVLVADENGRYESYTYVYHWMWVADDGLNNMFPCRRVGFAREEDAAHCIMIWGGQGQMYNNHVPLYQIEVPREMLNEQFPDLDNVKQMHKLFHWCRNNCRDQSFILLKYNEISFRDKDDAALFKLTWC